MSGVTSIQNLSGMNSDANPIQDPQKIAFLHGKVLHKISDAGKSIIQSINNVAQSILSKCIYVVSFGRYNLDSLKSYLFSNQTALESKGTSSFSNLQTSSAAPLRQAPPPPPMPENLDKALFSMRRSNAKIQDLSSRGFIASEALNRSSSVRSSTSSTQPFLQGDDGTLGDGTSSRRSSLDEDANISEQENLKSSSEIKNKSKGSQEGFMGITSDSIKNALKNLKPKKKVNQE